MIRKGAFLIPYAIRNGELVVYLQKRSKNAKRYPDIFSFWGGGIENEETPEQAVIREIKEELEYNLEKFTYLDTFKYEDMEEWAYYTEVESDFDKKVKINEGEYGKWFTFNEIREEKNMLDEDKQVLEKLLERI